MDGAKVTMSRGAHRRPYDPANFITYAVAAFVTFVGLGFLLYFCFSDTDGGIKPFIVISAFIALIVFVANAVGFFLPPESKISRLIHCEKTMLTFAVFFTILLAMFGGGNTYADCVFSIVLLSIIGASVTAHIVITLLDLKERTIIELFLFAIIGWACVIRLGRIAELCGNLCLGLCIGGFSAYLIGTVIGSISAVKSRRLIKSFMVVLGTALNFVGIFFYYM